MKVKEGDKLPDAKVFVLEKDPKEVSIKEIIGNDKAILFGLPGAFTPTCSAKHLPGFVSATDQLKEKKIKKIICISINVLLKEFSMKEMNFMINKAHPKNLYNYSVEEFKTVE